MYTNGDNMSDLWVSVLELLPPEELIVRAYDLNGDEYHAECCIYDFKNVIWFDHGSQMNVNGFISHWQYITNPLTRIKMFGKELDKEVDRLYKTGKLKRDVL